MNSDPLAEFYRHMCILEGEDGGELLVDIIAVFQQVLLHAPKVLLDHHLRLLGEIQVHPTFYVGELAEDEVEALGTQRQVLCRYVPHLALLDGPGPKNQVTRLGVVFLHSLSQPELTFMMSMSLLEHSYEMLGRQQIMRM